MLAFGWVILFLLSVVALEVQHSTGTTSMSRGNKRKAGSEFFVSSNNFRASNYSYQFSEDGRRIRTRGGTRIIEVPVPSSSVPPPDASNGTGSFTQSAPDVLDNTADDFTGTTHQITFSDQVRPVRVKAKEKAKRYENSVCLNQPVCLLPR